MERQVGGINTEIRDLIRNNFYILNENNRQKKNQKQLYKNKPEINTKELTNPK